MTRQIITAMLLVLVGQALALRSLDNEKRGRIRAAQNPPAWPDVYEMEYTLTLPYVQTLQPGGLKYPVHVWWDGPAKKYRIDFYGGLDSTGFDVDEGLNWNVYPRIREVACDYTNGTAGPTAAISHAQLMQAMGLGDGGSSTPLPDISGWEYAGTAQLGNADATVWQFTIRHGEKTAEYTFYTARNGWPLRLYMMGVNLLTGSHFDEYIIEFTRFKPGPIPASAFALPAACEGARSRQAQPQQQTGVAARLGALLPAVRVGAGFAPSGALSELRNKAASAFEANARMVDEHNRRNRLTAATAANAEPAYTLSLNHFAYMTHEQWSASMLGLAPLASRQTANRKRNKLAAAAGADGGDDVSTRYYQRVLRDDQLPESVDWRGTGADGPGVKDQVSCGSCWAFSAVGAMQGAWFKATGQSLSFSEQQLVDCAWDYGNNGCAGGFIEGTLQYVVDAGGVAQESDYGYMAQNTFCRGPELPPPPTITAVSASGSAKLNGAPLPLTGRFSGYLNVPARDEKALMEAVALHGPVSILMNAALPPFKFYSEGVYFNPECQEGPDYMDHAILLVGYGTSPEGVDYWIIKNSWSKYWGMDGYAKVARKGNDCGITTDPVLAVVDPAAVALVQ